MLTHDRLYADLWIIEIPAEVAIKPNPVHFTSHQDLLASDLRNIVLDTTCRHAGSTAITAIQIDRHTPSVLGFFVQFGEQVRNVIQIPLMPFLFQKE